MTYTRLIMRLLLYTTSSTARLIQTVKFVAKMKIVRCTHTIMTSRLRASVFIGNTRNAIAKSRRLVHQFVEISQDHKMTNVAAMVCTYMC